MLQHPAILSVAKRVHRSAAQVVLRWALQRGVVPLPKSVTPSRIDANADITSWTLSEDDMRIVNSVDKHVRFIRGAPMAPTEMHWREIWDEDVPEVEKKRGLADYLPYLGVAGIVAATAVFFLRRKQ